MSSNVSNIELSNANLPLINSELEALFKLSGKAYFDALVKYLSEKTNSQFAFIGNYHPENRKITAQSFYANGAFVKHYQYLTADTPCENVIGNKICVYNENIQQLFSKDKDLVEFGIEGYIGMPLHDLDNNTVGIIHVMDKQPLKNVEEIKRVFTIIKSKTELELERIYIQESSSLSYKELILKNKETTRLEIAYLIAQKSQRRLTNISSLIEFIHHILNDFMDASNFYIALNDEGRNEIYMPYIIDQYLSTENKELRVPYAKKGITEHILENNKIIDYSGEEFKAFIAENKIKVRGRMPKHYLGMPLKSEGKAFGAMVLQSYSKESLANEDKRLLNFISTQIAYTLEKSLWQEALIKKEHHYHSLVEHSSEIIGILNKNGKIEYISESVLKILKYKPAELIGRELNDFLKIEGFEGRIKKTLLNPEEYQLEIIRIADKNGVKKYLEVAINTKEESFIFNAKDVTERVILDKKNKQAAKRINTLHLVEKKLLSNKPLDELLDNVLKVILKNVFEVDRASVSIFNLKMKVAEILALKTSFEVKKGVKLNEKIAFKEMESINTVLSNKSFYVADISKLKKLKLSDQKNQNDGIQSYYIRPIVINDKVIGALNFGSKKKDDFKNRDEEILNEITQLIAVVINEATIKKELAKSEEEFATIFNSSEQGIAKVSVFGGILVVNEHFSLMLGYSKKQLQAKTFNDITYKEDVSKSQDYLNLLISGNSNKVTLNKRFIHKKGNILNVTISSKAIYHENGELNYLISFITDKTKELVAIKNRNDIKDALDSSSSVFYTDSKGKILEVNKKLEVVSGYSKKEMIGETPKIFSSNYYSSEDWASFWKTISAGKTFSGEIRNKRKDGSFYWVFETVTPIHNEKNKIEKFISVQQEITKEKIERSNLIREVLDTQESARERFAMEIHDGLGQTLLAAKMNLNVVASVASSFDEDTQVVVENTERLLTQSIKEARDISHGLMSRVVTKFGLVYALKEMISNINNTSELNFVFKTDITEMRFSEEVEMGVYRTLQELIKNIIKHAEATKASLVLNFIDNNLIIAVTDNGIGIAKGYINNPKTGGIGFRNMRARIEYLGGTFIISKPKKGTKIKINILIK